MNKKVKRLTAYIFVSTILSSCNKAPTATYSQPLIPIVEKYTSTCTCKNKTKTTTVKPTTTTKDSSDTSKKDTATKTTTEKTEVKKETEKPKETTTQTSTSDTASKLMEKILGNIRGAKYIEALVNKSEKKLATGEVTENELKLFAKSNGLTKIDVIFSSKTSTGTKLLYTHGEQKVKIRPNGALSLITTSLDMNDERLVSSNGWPLNQTDFFGMADRLGSASYKSEVVGKSTIDNSEVFIIKLSKKSGDNEMDSRIKYEQIYFDTKTYIVKLWEAYNDEKDPFFKINVKEMKFHESLDENNFKL